MRSAILAFFFTLSAIALSLVAIRCTGDDAQEEELTEEEGHRWLNLADSAEYVGMATCRNCHENIYQSFIQTGMGQSFGEATLGKSAGKYGHQVIYDKDNDFYYLPFWKDSVLFVKEYRLNNGDTVHSRTERIDYIIGSGHHTNSHIISRNSYLYQAPFTWYVEEGKLDLPPGFEGGFNSRFSRALGAECLTCHNGYPTQYEGSLNRYHTVPQGIDCERCHGPGSIHVAQKKAGKVVDIRHDTDFTIVNPRKLPYELQIDVCQRCHLQGNAVLKEGKSFYDFRPGMKLSEVMDVYMPLFQNTDGSFLMAAHAERLQKSPCFVQTNKPGSVNQLNCITCHNPHQSVRQTKQDYFIAKCQNCHAAASKDDCGLELSIRVAKNGNNCIKCHMPKTGTIDIPHVTITDHYIRVVKDAPTQTTNTDWKFLGLKSYNNDNPNVLSRAKAFLFFYDKFDHKPYYLDSAAILLKKIDPKKEPEVFILYHYMLNDWNSVTQVPVSPSHKFGTALPMYHIGQSYFNLGQFGPSVQWLQRAVNQEPLQLQYRLALAAALTQNRQFAEAEKELNFILEQNDQMAEAWNNRAFLALVRYDFEKAQADLKKALSLDPDLVSARINQAKLFLAKEDVKSAKAIVQNILKKHPQDKDAQALWKYLSQL